MSDHIDEIVEKATTLYARRCAILRVEPQEHQHLRAVAEAAYEAGQDQHTERVFQKWAKRIAEQREEFDKNSRCDFAREVFRKIDIELDLKCGMDRLTFESWLREQAGE